MSITKFQNERVVNLLSNQRACMACGVAVEYVTPEERAAVTAAAGFHNSSPPARTDLGRVTAAYVGGKWTKGGIEGGTRVDTGPAVAFPWSHPQPAPETLTIGQRVHAKMQAERAAGGEQRTVELVRCGVCIRRVQEATDLLAQLPNVAAAHGNVGVERLTTALDALAAMGKKGPTLRQVASLMSHMLAPGIRAAWHGHLSPVLVAGASPDVAVSEPWGFLSPEDGQALRDGYGHVLAEMVAAGEPPVSVGAPGKGLLSGCGFCGRGDVKVPAIKVLRAGGVDVAQRFEWLTRDVSDARAFGGQSFASNRAVTVALCRPCSEAVEKVGAVSASAMEYAFLTAAGELGAAEEDHEPIGGLIGWAGLWTANNEDGKGTLRPNLTPWAHVTMRPNR